jgi:C4-dicarboxylate-binding protein DctP
MKLSSPTANDVTFEWMKAFKAGAEARSGGKLKVEIYPANQLGQIPRTVEGVALGTIEVTIPATGFLIGLEPRFQIFDAMGLFDSTEHAMKVFHDADIRKRVASFGAAKGVEPLSVYIHSPNDVASRRPIRSLADIAGQKIRVPGSPLLVEPLRKLGAAPLSMPLGEVLPALQNRTIDGVLAGTTVFTAFKYYDIVKDLTQVDGDGTILSMFYVGKKWFDGLPADVRKAVLDTSAKLEPEMNKWVVDELVKAEATWKQHGGQIHRITGPDQAEFQKRMRAAADEVASKNPRIKDAYNLMVERTKATEK